MSGSYNGWINYETWCANLWLTNDEGTYNAVRAIAQAAPNHWEAGEDLKEWYHEDSGLYPDNLEGMAADLFTIALQAVQWAEIAKSLRE